MLEFTGFSHGKSRHICVCYMKAVDFFVGLPTVFDNLVFGQRTDEVILSLSLILLLEGLGMAEYGMLWMIILLKHRIILSQYDWIIQSHPKRIVL